VSFVVIRDNDGGDCARLKVALQQLCDEGGRDDTVVRIACQEMEAWYLGEPSALAGAFDAPELRDLGRRAKYRDPDAVARPSTVLERLIPEFQKVSGARRMAEHFEPNRQYIVQFSLADGQR
jgi:hypothetical protein